MCNKNFDRYKEDLKDKVEKSRNKVREYPISSIAIACGFGIGFGVIAGLVTGKLIDR